MSKTEPNTDGDGREQDDRMQIAEGVFIEDAFVDWQLSCSNTPEIVAITNKQIPREDWQPIEAHPDDDLWVQQNDHGLWAGWQTALPVSEETGMSTTTVEHAELGTVEDRYPAFDHIVKSEVNDHVPDSVASVKFKTGAKGSIQSIPVWVGVINNIVDTYINGSMGSETVSYWYWSRSHPEGWGWHSVSDSKSDYEGYLSPEVVLVRDRIYTWHPKRRQDLTEEDQVFRIREDL